ncbi:hypothetical protein CEXT_27231 [Caerostris extrusa]|uniref:Uncharacterized protein n=1 Tax=Caerostris extrusa TaxID=172846 RepID=A0AAV4QSB3_CAEEX|nr:hypothetical protein CEXT_27231 [Caerostris extrusa]
MPNECDIMDSYILSHFNAENKPTVGDGRDELVLEKGSRRHPVFPVRSPPGRVPRRRSMGTCRRISNTKMKSASTFGRRKKTFKAKDNLALFLFMRPLFPPCVLGEGFYGVIAVPSRFRKSPPRL